MGAEQQVKELLGKLERSLEGAWAREPGAEEALVALVVEVERARDAVDQLALQAMHLVRDYAMLLDNEGDVVARRTRVRGIAHSARQLREEAARAAQCRD